jgi:gamma-glutamylcyclotransferase (GGCT)/AIG2-like uncharacterized protein YtfP
MNDEIGTDGLFVYGSLRFPEILEILLGRVPPLAPAAVTGWRVRALPGVTYPGLVADPGTTAEGVLITGLTEAELRILDAFEDDLYEPAVLPLAGGAGRARAYVWHGPPSRTTGIPPTSPSTCWPTSPRAAAPGSPTSPDPRAFITTCLYKSPL